MKKRFVALLLVLILSVSVLAIPVNAAELTYTIEVDFSQYSGTVKSAVIENESASISEDYTSSVEAGKVSTITYTYDREKVGEFIQFKLTLDPIQKWVINGTEYTENTSIDNVTGTYKDDTLISAEEAKPNASNGLLIHR